MLKPLRTKLQKMADPAIRRTVRDEETGEEFQLTDEELQLLIRIESGRFPTAHADDEIVFTTCFFNSLF
jgi:hypothetical protein